MIQVSMKELQILHAFHSDTLAYRANVPESVVKAMLQNKPVSLEHAHQVLQALSLQTGCYYTLSNVLCCLNNKD